MPVFEAPPPSSALALLPGATFADAFAIDVADPALDAETAARRSLGATQLDSRLACHARCSGLPIRLEDEGDGGCD